ncbi:hypothetical protein BST81_12575 [Leptolyngbya sp. 'hensonii']|uniref:hypothetical protein n=1 Tax=Leptolyngbya sp. 'hensonii' TaxID=1922337 RepID=UPI00094FB919|nr:hypothetical protein [Leptolyngbya sp. 'hensonii']OLP17888.1 hypothetical protein BST81_12575 [Leptolyngbya sp. 'hensonii']
MTPLMLRQLWSLVEATQTHVLLSLDDNSLVQWLLRQLGQERSLNHHETDIVSHYIQSRLSLIRDLAQARMAQ